MGRHTHLGAYVSLSNRFLGWLTEQSLYYKIEPQKHTYTKPPPKTTWSTVTESRSAEDCNECTDA